MSIHLRTDMLSAADIRAICGALTLPEPTDEAPLEVLIAAHYAPDEIWSKLKACTEETVMIATAVLSGRMVRCKPDPRLNPLPLPVIRPTTPAATSPATSPAISPKISPATPTGLLCDLPPWRNPNARIATVTPNPKKKGSAAYERYAKWKVGASAEEMRTAGLQQSDFRWDGERRFVTWTVIE